MIITVQPTSKPILAKNVLYPDITLTYSSITSFANAVKGDRATIRKYLNTTKSDSKSLYRKQGKLILVGPYLEGGLAFIV